MYVTYHIIRKCTWPKIEMCWKWFVRKEQKIANTSDGFIFFSHRVRTLCQTPKFGFLSVENLAWHSLQWQNQWIDTLGLRYIRRTVSLILKTMNCASVVLRGRSVTNSTHYVLYSTCSEAFFTLSQSRHTVILSSHFRRRTFNKLKR